MCSINSLNSVSIDANSEIIYCLFPSYNCTVCVLEIPKENVFVLNYILNLFNSEDAILHISETPVYKKLVTSANVIHVMTVDTLYMSLIYRKIKLVQVWNFVVHHML